MPTDDPAKLTKVSVSLPFGLGSAEWQADPSERRAAWTLYVELMSRVSVQRLDMDEGLAREALDSLHDLFGITRRVLIDAGPSVGARKLNSVGGTALAVLNSGLRPFLSKWHPLLLEWEQSRAPDSKMSQRAYERSWGEAPKLRGELDALRPHLARYAEVLATVAGVSG